MKYADNPWCDYLICGYKYFSGDDRSYYDVWSDKFRTRSDVYLTWSGSNRYVRQHPQTGITIGYDANYREIGRGQADPVASHEVWNIQYGSDYIYHRMRVAAGNPLTIAPDIDAFYYAKVYRDGRGEFYGIHDLAPSHEFYIITYPGDFWGTIHRHAHVDFMYLFPHYPKDEWQINLY